MIDNESIILIPEECSYNYPSYNEDKIYCYKIDQNLTKEVFDFALETRKNCTQEMLDFERSMLAGDLSEEYGLDFRNNLQLLRKIEKMMLSNLSRMYESDVLSFKIDRIWVNFQKPNEYNPIHSHTGRLSLVWYLDLPQCIREEHLNQHSNTLNRGLIQFYSTHTTDSMVFNPETSDMFIFNSKHRHAVYPFRSNVERVSLSMNLIDICVFSDFYGSMKYL